MLLAENEPGARCGLLFAEVLQPGTYALVVDGAYDNQEGYYELNLVCEDMTGPTPEDRCGE